MDANFWESVYQSGQTRFDLRGPTAALCDFLGAHSLAPGRAVVPGCGRGHDVLELARRGWDALGIDFAPSAIHDSREAAARAGLQARARFEPIDLFDLAGLPERALAGQAARPAPFDLWWENTCYCAIEPSRRDDYARAAARLVRPGGVLLFLVFPTDGREGGPPFAIAPGEIEPRFGSAFTLESIAPPARASAPAREGKELLALLRRRGPGPGAEVRGPLAGGRTL